MTDRALPPLLDAHAYLGPDSLHDVGPCTAESLLATMDLVGIETALVTDRAGREYDPAEGNRAVVAATHDLPRLLPCWTVLPATCGQLDPADTFVAAAVDSGVALLRAYPQRHGYDLADPALTGHLSTAAAAGLPLLVDALETDFAAVAALAGAIPDLTIVIGLAGYRVLRDLAGLFTRFPNVLVDTANLSSHCGLEWLTDRFGIARIVFGTGAPQRDPAEAVTRLAWSELTDDAVAAIGHGNLRSLLRPGLLRQETSR